MDVTYIKKLEVHFVQSEDRRTGLTVTCGERHVFDVAGTATRSIHKAVDMAEFVERRGAITSFELDTLLGQLREVDTSGWYHHYRRPSGAEPYWRGESNPHRWSVEVAYRDGRTVRWEGGMDAPDNIEEFYEACLALGMPDIRTRYQYYMSSLGFMRCGEEVMPDTAPHFLAYDLGLIADAHKAHPVTAKDGRKNTSELLLKEFTEDLRIFIDSLDEEHAREQVPVGWPNARDIEELCAIDVEQASKRQVYLLFDALLRVPNLEDALVVVRRTRAFSRWFGRLKKIPREEAREQRRREEEEREKMRRRIEDSLKVRIARGNTEETFSSKDVAQESDATPSMARGRILALLRKGSLEEVPNETPKRYRVAACA